MNSIRSLMALAIGSVLLSAGCRDRSPVAVTPKSERYWESEAITHEGYSIRLGFRESQESSKVTSTLELLALITRDGKPVAGAMVFQRLVGGTDTPTVGDELASRYEPSAGDQPALYVSPPLTAPAGTSLGRVRWRIALPEVDEDWTGEFDGPAPVTPPASKS